MFSIVTHGGDIIPVGSQR